MNLLDADVLAEEGRAEPPPFEDRMNLPVGAEVELLAEDVDRQWGIGIARLAAVVVEKHGPGRYRGVADGDEISFTAHHVSGISGRRAELGSLFDWLKKQNPKSMFEAFKKPETPELPALPAPPSEMIPAIPPPEKKGLLAPFRGLLKAFQAPAAGETARKSMFEVFRPPEAPSGLPAERPEMPPAPFVEKPSMFSAFAPGAPPGPLTQYVEAAKEMFKVFPAGPEETFEARQARQQELWSGMFTAEAAPPAAMFQPFQESEVEPEAAAIPPGLEEEGEYMKVVPLPRRTTLLPSVEDLARGFTTFFDLPDLFIRLRSLATNASWQEELRESGYVQEGLESLGTCGGEPDLMQETASFLHIPWSEFEKRAVTETYKEGGETFEEWVDTDLIWEEILWPASELMSDVMNMLKPEDLPGRFIVKPTDDHGCMLALYYVEGTSADDEEAEEGTVGAEEGEVEVDPAAEEEEEPEEEEEIIIEEKPKKKKKKKKKK